MRRTSLPDTILGQGTALWQEATELGRATCWQMRAIIRPFKDNGSMILAVAANIRARSRYAVETDHILPMWRRTNASRPTGDDPPRRPPGPSVGTSRRSRHLSNPEQEARTKGSRDYYAHHIKIRTHLRAIGIPSIPHRRRHRGDVACHKDEDGGDTAGLDGFRFLANQLGSLRSLAS